MLVQHRSSTGFMLWFSSLVMNILTRSISLTDIHFTNCICRTNFKHVLNIFKICHFFLFADFFVLITGNCHFLHRTKSALFSLKCEKYCYLRAHVSWRTLCCFIFKNNKRNDIYYLALYEILWTISLFWIFFLHSSKSAVCCLSSDYSLVYCSFILNMINVMHLEGLIQLPNCCWLVTFQMLLSAI